MTVTDNFTIMTTDRANRDRLAAAIRRYLAEETTAFEFDEEIFQVRGTSHDPTIKIIAASLWFHYDDCKDHKVVLSKGEWDYFHRLLLVLESDAVIHNESWRVWSASQLVAIVALVAFAACALWLGIGEHLVLVAMPFGILSMLLARWRRGIVPEMTPEELRLTPFKSVSQLRAVRRSVGGFIKRRYPQQLTARRIRSPLMGRLILLPMHVVWLPLAPVLLLFQSLPLRDACVSVRSES